MSRWLALALVPMFVAPAVADDSIDDSIAKRTEATRERGANLFYGELLGKGGLYGLGYERRLTRRLSLGAAASFAVVRDQQLLTIAPYLHATLAGGTRHALFAELGPTFVRSHVPSPVDGWDGMTESGAGGFASLGWEFHVGGLVLRASGSVAAGEGGVAPFAGLAIGWRP